MSYFIQTPIFRFAPSPNGHLHLGHAYSVLLNQRMACDTNGKLLLRVEDIDLERCTLELEDQMLFDLEWLGIDFSGTPMRQSEQFERYQSALDDLMDAGLLYPATLSRGAVKREVARFEDRGEIWPRDPDGTALYPTLERHRSAHEINTILEGSEPYSLRLNMERAMAHINQKTLSWNEEGKQILADPSKWGDVVLARKDTPASYHLCVVLDDAQQDVSHVVRGRDLYHATSVHRLLQELLGLPEPKYYHHDLLLDSDGKKLSKSQSQPQILSNEFNHFGVNSASISQLRECGATQADILKMVALE